MLSIKSALIALLLGAAAAAAPAQEAYVTGGLSRSNWDFECGPDGCSRSSSAWRLGAGYRFNRLVALEAFHASFGHARSSQPGLAGQFGGTADGVQALLGWQFGPVDLAGKVGAAAVRADFQPSAGSFDQAASARHTEPTLGAMAAWRLTPRVALRLDVDIVTVAIDSYAFVYSRGADVTTYSLGLMVSF